MDARTLSRLAYFAFAFAFALAAPLGRLFACVGGDSIRCRLTHWSLLATEDARAVGSSTQTLLGRHLRCWSSCNISRLEGSPTIIVGQLLARGNIAIGKEADLELCRKRLVGAADDKFLDAAVGVARVVGEASDIAFTATVQQLARSRVVVQQIVVTGSLILLSNAFGCFAEVDNFAAILIDKIIPFDSLERLETKTTATIVCHCGLDMGSTSKADVGAIACTRTRFRIADEHEHAVDTVVAASAPWLAIAERHFSLQLGPRYILVLVDLLIARRLSLSVDTIAELIHGLVDRIR